MYDTAYHSESIKDKVILVSGAAGFIGSHLVEYLLKYGARVVGLDSLVTGLQSNVDLFKDYPNYTFFKGDIRIIEDCNLACKGVDVICHQAALGSVPRSIQFPLATNDVNSGGFLNILEAAKTNGIKRVVFASSSSVYGDSMDLPKREDKIGRPLSPYAVSKYTNELYAKVYADAYGLEIIGLRYFNVFGPRQNPEGEYAAVIPLFMKAMLSNGELYVNGDGEQSRDFTFVENAVQANIKSLFTKNKSALGEMYNVAYGERYTLNELVQILQQLTDSSSKTIHRDAREGDIRDSLADISKAKQKLNYQPLFSLNDGLKIALDWFKENKESLGL